MKMRFSFLFFLTAMFSCNDFTPETSNDIETSSYKIIDPRESQELTSILSNLSVGSSNGRIKTAFGEIKADEAIQKIDRSVNITTYTLGFKASIDFGPFAIQNLVIRMKGDKVSSYVIVYEPEVEWVLANQSINLGKFTGKIHVFLVTGELQYSTALKNGVTTSTSGGRAMTCIVVTWRIEVSSEYYTHVYYETDILDCFGSGSSGGTGGGGSTGGGSSSDGGASSGGGGSTGGGSSGGSSGNRDGVPIYEDDYTNYNKLCGAYTFTPTGEGLTGEIAGLGAKAIHSPSGRFVSAYWGSICVTFGSSTIANSSASASDVFNQAWNASMEEVDVWLNSTNDTPSNLAFSNFIFNALRSNLSTYAGGYIGISSGPCAGNIPHTLVRYCN